MTALAAPLNAHLRIRSQFRRSINVERDQDGSGVADYIPTARAVEVLRRLNTAMRDPGAVRAFSLTGPYGAGKSSFALFLTALLGDAEDPTTLTARDRLHEFAPEDLHDLQAATQEFGSTGKGFIRAVATAQSEPAAATVVRALNHGAESYWGTRGPRRLRAQLKDALRNLPSARELSDLVAVLADHAPVLIILDEFGKNLEFFAQNPADGDIFLLQQLAERLSGENGARGFLVTLQHMAFEQYAATTTWEQRREWSKVQGRFNDVSFLHDTGQTVRLIAQSLDRDNASKRVHRDIRAWANAQYRSCGDLGLVPQLIASAEQVDACYPINPVATLAVSELCARIGQHDRTLFSFLASGEAGSVARFLVDHRPASGSLPTIAIDAIWDYFLESAATSVGNSPDGSRWLEINARIRDFHGLSELDLRCAKAIGLLNLLDRGGALRASSAMVAFGLGLANEAEREQVTKALRRLERAGVLTYRRFADEFRLWEGTDFDIIGEIESSRIRLAGAPLAHLLEHLQPLRPAVASRHSQRVGMLRYFEVRFLTAEEDGPLLPEDGADGLLGVVLGPDFPSVSSADQRPVVLAVAGKTVPLGNAALEASAILDVLDRNEGLANDRVARRELQERAGVALHTVRAELDMVLRSMQTARLVGGEDFPVSGSFSRLVSDVCDRVYALAPQVRNEMLGRRELSSQGAKARRRLLSAMVGSGSLPELGMDHYGPERAMYEAALRHTGMHREVDATWSFAAPYEGDTWSDAWQAAESLIYERAESGVGFGELYRLLEAPPFGLKHGPIPVLLTTIMLAKRDEIAIYQDGTYQPELTDNLLERLVKTPDRFSAKAITVKGLRGDIVDDLGVALGAVLPPPRRRNPTVLRVVAPLLTTVRGLPEFTRRTSDLAPETLAVRTSIASARDPAELLFATLPEACGIEPISDSLPSSSADSTIYVERVIAAVEELTSAYPRMLGEAATAIAAAFVVPATFPDLRADLRARARPLEGRVIDPQVRSFLLHAIDTQLDDEQWLEAMLFSVSGAAPASWRDDDSTRFAVRLAELAGAFRRIEALHYDTVKAERAGFDARRITVTAPTGREISSVFWVDHAVVEQVRAAAELALEKLDSILGPGALPALLAVLASKADTEQSGDEWVEGANSDTMKVPETIEHGGRP